MFYNSNNFRPKAIHTFYIKELPIKVRRNQWREIELKRRKELFSFSHSVSSLFTRICIFLKIKDYS